MPTVLNHPSSALSDANNRKNALQLHLVTQDSGWVVGIYSDGVTFEKLLPYCEAQPYRSREAAAEAASIWVDIQPEYKPPM